MVHRVIPIVKAEQGLAAVPPRHAGGRPERRVAGPLRDAYARPLHDLRISVTDKCNFRCVYCMPKHVFGPDFAFLPPSALLSFEEIERVARVAVSLGVRKVRLTGGEPLLRRNLETLVQALSSLRADDGEALDLTLTTNGSLLTKKAALLAAAGLTRITVSLDALDEVRFQKMNDAEFPVSRVLDGIQAARDAGLPVKVNMVVKRGLNDDDIVPMARHFHGTGVTLRFIEFMDVGSSNGWRLEDTVPSREVIDRLSREFMPLVPIGRGYAAETAERWSYLDGGGEVGVISSVTHAFCGNCTRARLSTEGLLFTCLFASSGTDLRQLLRDPAVSDADVAAALAGIWEDRTDRYSEQRGTRRAAPRGDDATRVEMSYIGG